MGQIPLGVLLNCSAKSAKQYLDYQVKDFGITPIQSRAMMALHENRGQDFSQKDLEKALMLKAPTVNGIVDRLEEKKLIIRQPSQVDRRRKNLILTEEGEQTRLRFKERLQEAEMAMQSSFSDEELARFREYLFRVIDSLKIEED